MIHKHFPQIIWTLTPDHCCSYRVICTFQSQRVSANRLASVRVKDSVLHFILVFYYNYFLILPALGSALCSFSLIACTWLLRGSQAGQTTPISSVLFIIYSGTIVPTPRSSLIFSIHNVVLIMPVMNYYVEFVVFKQLTSIVFGFFKILSPIMSVLTQIVSHLPSSDPDKPHFMLYLSFTPS